MRKKLTTVLVSAILAFLAVIICGLINNPTLGNGSFFNRLPHLSVNELYLPSFLFIVFMLSSITVSGISAKREIAEKKAYKKDRDLLILHSATSISATSLDADAFLHDLLHEFLFYLEADYGFIHMVRHDIGKAVLVADAEVPTSLKTSICNVPLEKSFFSDILKINDPSEKTIKPLTITLDSETYPGMNSGNYVVFPMVAHNQTIGSFVFSVKQDFQLNEDDLYVLESVGKLAGITVENIELLEKTTKSYEELKSLDQMKDEFISNVTHELKTPLISIKGYSEIMYEGMLGDLNEKQRQGLKVIVSNSERLHSLIESLLHMNAFQFNKQHIFSPLCLTDVLENTIKSLSLKIEEKGMSLDRNFAKNMRFVYGNTEILKQLFVYLLDNAVKFSQKSGSIEISVSEENEWMHVKISDHGVGIPENHLPRIFDRFYQVDGSMTRNYGGNGLGLYLSKNIVEVHGGRIWIESTEGVGTTVHVLLPVYVEKNESMEKVLVGNVS
ncbi:ATP-binding protein [Methanolobus sp. ZRKC2]|uniref:ATP-binding protein n=1 Tax=Methanolobus sp. ZRKC2 TaxID=3125783 RepID=UPI00324A6FB7